MSKDSPTASHAAPSGAKFVAKEVSSSPQGQAGDSSPLRQDAGTDLTTPNVVRRAIRPANNETRQRAVQRYVGSPQLLDSGMEPPVVTDGYQNVYSAHAQLSGQGEVPPAGVRRGERPSLYAFTGDGQKSADRNLYAFTGDQQPGNGTLDPKKSIAELLADPSLKGKLRVSDQPADPNDAARQADKLKQGERPRIKVVYSDESDNPNKPQPDFVVKKDGSIQVVNDIEKNPDAEIVVVVERNKGETGAPPKAQQESIDELVGYLGQRLQDKYDYPTIDVKDGGETKKVEQVPIQDAQNLVSDAVEQKFGNMLPPEKRADNTPVPDVPDNVRNISDQVSRVGGSGGQQTFDRGAGDRNFTPREVAPPQNETAGVSAVKDTIAAFVKGDKGYDTVQRRGDGSYAVGRYGFNFFVFGDWLEDLLGIDLGDPPDFSKLREALKKNPALRKKLADAMQKMAKGGDDGKGGKVSQEFADKFKVGADGNFENQKFVDDFLGFGDKMKGNGEAVTNDDVKNFMPKELQEIIAQDRIEKFAAQMGIQDADKMKPEEAAKVGLAMFLGRVPTEGDLANGQYQQYMRDFSNMFTLAKARQENLGDITITDAQGKVLASAQQSVGQQKWAQTQFANSVDGGNLGCAASVSKVLQDIGFSYANSAGVGNLSAQLKKHGWTELDISQARPGDVVYGWEPGTNLYQGGGGAHIGIVGENGSVYHNNSAKRYWTQGTLASVFNSGRFGNQIRVLRPPQA